MMASMYSGVSGMKAHQTRMNVIGNNIANVNTYGFKGSRATFRDVYYQSLKGSSGATASSGGGNASQMGYGAQLGSIDVLQTRSTFTMTDKSTDLAIDGEGFFQVQDADGNVFYTRAGQIDFDSEGNLVDAQRRFVLGIQGDPLGRPSGSDKIKVNVPPVPPNNGALSDEINGVKIKIEAANNTKDGNVSFTFSIGDTMTDGLKATAQVGTSGISIKLNPKEVFTSAADFEKAVNDAINKYTQEKTGKDHPAGGFKFTFDPTDAFPAGGLTGKEICSTDFAVQQGKFADWPSDTLFGGFKPTGVSGSEYKGTGAVDVTTTNAPKAVFTPAAGDVKAYWTFSMTVGGQEYSGKIDSDRLSSGKMNLYKGGTPNSKDYIEFNRPSYTELNNLATGLTTGEAPTDPLKMNLTLDPADPAEQALLDALGKAISSPAEKSKALGLSSKNLILADGTEGGEQDLSNLSGISVGQDGVITAHHAVLGDITVGRIDLCTFANPSGLVQAGGTSFTTGPNSGKMTKSPPGTGGSGPLVSGSLELSNVDLSREFSDMITTQRGFQANSRLITVSDAMLEELVNLKR